MISDNFYLRRTVKDIDNMVPAKMDITIWLKMDVAHRHMYEMFLNSKLVNLNRPGVRGPYRSPLMLHSKASSPKISSHSPADSCQDSLSLSLSQESIPARDEQYLCTQGLSLSREQAADKDAAFHSQRDESVQGGHTQREEGWFGILQEVTCLHEQKPRPRSRSLEGQRGPCAAQGETR